MFDQLCPGQAATRRRCGAEPEPRSGRRAATWAPALQRTVEVTLRRVRGTRGERGARSLHMIIAMLLCTSERRCSRVGKGALAPCPRSPSIKQQRRGHAALCPPYEIEIVARSSARRLSFPAKARHPARRGLSVRSRRPLEYWIARSWSAIAHWPGDDSACVTADMASQPRGSIRPSFAWSCHPLKTRATGREVDLRSDGLKAGAYAPPPSAADGLDPV
jgi:hypothetical protein